MPVFAVFVIISLVRFRYKSVSDDGCYSQKIYSKCYIIV